MRKIKEILRLSLKEGLSQRAISQSTRVGKTTIQELMHKCKLKNVTWEQLEGLTETNIAQLLLPQKPTKDLNSDKTLPNWGYIRTELMKKGLTISLLWLEYKEENPSGLSYSRFCYLYRKWQKESHLTLRQHHIAGEKMFVDFSGLTVPWLNVNTGEIHEAQIFVATLGASNYTFVKACADQTLHNWIYAHTDAFHFFEGVTEIIVPDNLRSGVSRSCRYDPDINPTYLSMAEHYDTVIIPTRARKPRDKSKVEVAVQIVQRWILAILRRQTFTSIEEINLAIKPLLEKLNTKIMKPLNVSRYDLWIKYEKDILKKCNEIPFEIPYWKTARVNIDYHIEYDRHYYSVPYRYVGLEVRVKSTRSLIEIFCSGELISQHKKVNNEIYRHSTITSHMPPKHSEHVKWTPEKILNWAMNSGPETRFFCENIISNRKHVEQGFRSCLGVLRLGKIYDSFRLENACLIANQMKSYRYKTVKDILKQGRDKLKNETEIQFLIPIPVHENIRGSDYYK